MTDWRPDPMLAVVTALVCLVAGVLLAAIVGPWWVLAGAGALAGVFGVNLLVHRYRYGR